jgi:N-acetylglucosaminyldiphosphoundecaprenol N-acetyl-beta-D-mannosaminyltransferase
MQSISILGVRVDVTDTAAAMETMEGFIRSRQPHQVVTADASGVILAQRDRELMRIINGADLVTPDSTGILWAAKRFGTPLPERVSGIDLLQVLCAEAAKTGYGVFCLGSEPGVADAAAEELKRRYPGLDIVGTHHGYFGPEESDEVVRKVHDASPDILFVAFGIPRQEKWIHRYMKEMRVPLAIGVGGSFDVISGKVKRAPVWMQKHGLEWMHRLISNPKKYRKCMTLPVFAWKVLRANQRKPKD